MNTSESIKELATALCSFQGEVEKINKEATNPFFKSKYATLANILDVIREPLHKNGLSFVQFPTGQFGLVTRLMHNSGEWLEAEYEMQPTKNTPQEIGSCITYMRRYALGSILGLNIDEDDDGNAASKPTTQPQQTETNEDRKVIKDVTKVLAMIKAATTLDELKKIQKGVNASNLYQAEMQENGVLYVAFFNRAQDVNK